MPKREGIYRIGSCIKATQRHVAGVSKGDDQLAQFRQTVKRPASLGFRFQQRKRVGKEMKPLGCRQGVCMVSVEFILETAVDRFVLFPTS